MNIEPKAFWVLAGGCCLAALAAAVNVGLLLHAGTSVSHLTGDVSRFAADLVHPESSGGVSAGTLAVAVGGFVVGAGLSGFFIHHRGLELTRPYGRSITAIGGLLLLAWWAMPRSADGAAGLAAMACGFQNALATHHRGVVLRTTHVTGLLTDLGLALGMRVRGGSIARWAWTAPLGLTLAFFFGALGGTALTLVAGPDALAILGATYVVGGLAWSQVKRMLVLRARTSRS